MKIIKINKNDTYTEGYCDLGIITTKKYEISLEKKENDIRKNDKNNIVNNPKTFMSQHIKNIKV